MNTIGKSPGTHTPSAASLVNDISRSGDVENLGLDLRDIGQGSKEQQAKRIAVQFEQTLISTLLKEAFKSEDNEDSGEDGEEKLLKGGSFKSLRMMFLSQYIADNGGLGYQKAIEEQLLEKIRQQNESGAAPNHDGPNTPIPLDRKHHPTPLPLTKQEENPTPFSLKEIHTVPSHIPTPIKKSSSDTPQIPSPPTRTPQPGSAPTPNPSQPSPILREELLPGTGKPSLNVSPTPAALPVEGAVSSPFGWRKDPIDGVTRFHAGVDFEAPVNTPVKSYMEGVVTASGWEKGYGRLVEVLHPNGLTTRYGHNAQLKVKKGDHVQAGDVIALSGSSGRSTGPHLHFEIRKGDYALDPSKILPFNTPDLR